VGSVASRPDRSGVTMEPLRLLLIASLVALLTGCAGPWVRDPVNVDVVGVEPLQGQGMEGRFLVKLRVQNPNDLPVEYDGVYVELEVRGSRFASGVSGERGTVPRFGEAIVAVPVSVPVTALVRQALGMASGGLARTDYRLRGRLGGPVPGGVTFSASGDFALPAGPAGTGARTEPDARPSP
jgi:LEA14-like dessication related protein